MTGHAQALQENNADCSLREHGRAALLLSIFLAASIVAGWFSDGVYHEDDLTHYVFARWSQFDGRYLLDSWGRPGFTIPYSWPASLGTSSDGLAACRIFSALLSAASAWLAYCIARRLGLRHPWSAIPLLYLQPLFASLSLTTLTETPLAFYFVLATWLLMTERAEWSAVIMALAPITRDEAVAILPLWGLAMLCRGSRWWSYPLLLWAVVAHNLLSGLTVGAWPLLRWLEPDGVDQYGSGTILTFVPKLAYVCGPVIMGLAVLGIRRVWRKPQGWPLVLCCLGWFALETVIYMRGAYSSGGYARFLVPICPWLAVLACAGAEPLFIRRLIRPALASLTATLIAIFTLCQLEWGWRVPVVRPEWQDWVLVGRLGAFAFCIAAGICYVYLRRCTAEAPSFAMRFTSLSAVLLLASGLSGLFPLRLSQHQHYLREYSPLIVQMADSDRPVLAVNRWFYHWADRWVSWEELHDVHQFLERARPGTLFVWDKRFCTEPLLRLNYDEIAARSGWRLVWNTEPLPEDKVPHLACFQRQNVMQAAKPSPGPRPN